MDNNGNVPAGEESQVNLQVRARRLVQRYYNQNIASKGEYDSVDIKDVYVVWFSKVLGNWKAMLGTTNPDGLYFEVTHDGAKNLTYVDHYEKQGQMIVEYVSADTMTEPQRRLSYDARKHLALMGKIANLHREGKSNTEIAEELNVTESAVQIALEP